MLERAVEAPEIVRALHSYGVTQAEVGAVTGVSDRAVRGWQRYVRPCAVGIRSALMVAPSHATPCGTPRSSPKLRMAVAR